MAQNTSIDQNARLDAVQAATFPGSNPAVPGAVPPAAAILAANFKNLLDGGDFTINPFQRNIPGLASGGVLTTPITSTPGYFADRFFGVGAAGSALVFAADADASVPGFNTSLRMQRQAANANVSPLTMGQVMETPDSIRCQGLPLCYSFWVYAGGNFSGGNLTIQIVSGTGTNQSAASLVAGTWTGQNVVGTASIPISTAAQRVFVTGTVPANATQIGVLISWTPTGTAGANDFIRTLGHQLELGSVPTNFEHRDVQVELEICQRYAWVTPEPAAGVVVGAGMNTTAAIQIFYMATPVQLRSAPTVTVSAGTFKTNQASVATATTITPGATHTPNAISVNGNSAGTAGQGTLLQGGGGTGNIIASSDF